MTNPPPPKRYSGPTNLGPATTIQVLDEWEVVEGGRFGELK
jgi:hypothetical protein